MDKKQMERIARHYLGERLIRVEHTPDNKPPFQVVYDSGSEYHDGMYGNNVEEMCIRIATELKARGWVPTHPRLIWYADGTGFSLSLCIDQFVEVLWMWVPEHGTNKANEIQKIERWHLKTMPSLYLPPFLKNEQ